MLDIKRGRNEGKARQNEREGWEETRRWIASEIE